MLNLHTVEWKPEYFNRPIFVDVLPQLLRIEEVIHQAGEEVVSSNEELILDLHGNADEYSKHAQADLNGLHDVITILFLAELTNISFGINKGDGSNPVGYTRLVSSNSLK